MKIARKKLFPFIWYGLIIYGSLSPSKNLPHLQLFPHFDKVVHFGIYFILTVLIIPVFITKLKYLRSYILAFVISIFSGVLFEILQAFLSQGRTASIDDAIANTLGSVGGILFYQLFLKEKKLEKVIFKIE